MHSSSECDGCFRATRREVPRDPAGAFPVGRIDGANRRSTGDLEGICGATHQQVSPSRNRGVSPDGAATTDMTHPTETELDSYIADPANMQRRAAIEAHLAECLDCKDYVTSASELESMAR